MRFTGEQILFQIAQALGTTVEQLSTTLSGSSTLDALAIIGPEGNSRAAAVNAAIIEASTAWADDGVQRRVRLLPGEFTLEAPIDIASGVRLDMDENTVLRPSYGGSADDRTNDVIRIVGTLDVATTTLTTALTPSGVAYYGAGARKVSVASGTGFVPGWVCIGGHETAVGETPGGSNGSSVTSAELVLLDTIESGTNFVLRAPTMQYHDTGAGGEGGTEPRFVCMASPVRNVAITGGKIDASGGTVAVGIRIDRAVGVDVVGTSVKGLSRAGIEVARGSRDVELNRIRNDGECATTFYFSACMDVGVHWHTSTRDGLRKHASDAGRAMVHMEFAPYNIVVDSSQFRHGVNGLRVNGGRHITIANCLVDDMLDDFTDPTLHGIGLDLGRGEGAYDEYVGPLNLSNLTFSNCRAGASTNPAPTEAFVLVSTVCFHDCHQVTATGLQVVNNGLSDSTTLDGDSNYHHYGFMFQDCNVILADSVVKGCQYGYAVRYPLGVTLDNCRYVGAPGSGLPSNIALWINAAGSLKINNFDAGGGAYFWTSDQYGLAQNGPYTLEMGGKCTFSDYTIEGPFLIAYDVTPASTTHGQVVALDPASATGVRQFITPTAGSHSFAAVCFIANGPYWPLKMLPSPGAQVLVNGAVDVDDYIEAVPGSRVAVKGTTPNALTIGVSAEKKGSGTALVKLGVPTYAS